jgi:hypothetical protein
MDEQKYYMELKFAIEDKIENCYNYPISFKKEDRVLKYNFDERLKTLKEIEILIKFLRGRDLND